jgi:hypothetical protein
MIIIQFSWIGALGGIGFYLFLLWRIKAMEKQEKEDEELLGDYYLGTEYYDCSYKDED